MGLGQYAQNSTAAAAWEALHRLRAHPRHKFWGDNFSYTELNPSRLTDYRQITDSWLAELALRRQGKLATLDLALSVLWPKSTIFIPV